MRIARTFRTIKQVKALAKILLEDGENVVKRGMGKGHDVEKIASDVLYKWILKHPDESHGVCLHAVLMDPRVDAADIARKFEAQLLEGKSSSLLQNAELYCFLALRLLTQFVLQT